jgi:hypothetical protein
VTGHGRERSQRSSRTATWAIRRQIGPQGGKRRIVGGGSEDSSPLRGSGIAAETNQTETSLRKDPD